MLTCERTIYSKPTPGQEAVAEGRTESELELELNTAANDPTAPAHSRPRLYRKSLAEEGPVRYTEQVFVRKRATKSGWRGLTVEMVSRLSDFASNSRVPSFLGLLLRRSVPVATTPTFALPLVGGDHHIRERDEASKEKV